MRDDIGIGVSEDLEEFVHLEWKEEDNSTVSSYSTDIGDNPISIENKQSEDFTDRGLQV